MADQQSRQFKVNKLTLTTLADKEFNLKDMVGDFRYMESIEAPFTRIEFTMIDAVDFNLNLQGGEKVDINLETESADDKGKLKMVFKVYKIGDIIKSERGQLYKIFCCSPEMYNNELNKVFKAFGPIDEGGSKDVDNIPKHVVKEYLKAPGNRIKEEHFEDHSRVIVVSPNWRPVDLISYVSDKVTRKTSGKGESKQSGFLFYENQRGYQFRSIDGLCEQDFEFVYTYKQQGQLEDGDPGYYNIESIQYPDKANHLRHMRLGTYKTVTTGICVPYPSLNNATQSGNSSDKNSAPSGTVYPARETAFDTIFARASKLHVQPPFNMPEEVKGEGASPTRQKMRIIPALAHQQGDSGQPKGDPDNGTQAFDTLAVAEYAAARYNLMKAIQLTIKVPGNTALCAGDIVKLIIPSSKESGEKVERDRKFSGKYLIAAHTFFYSKKGCTSELLLIRDSIPKKG
tara:strand:+ start:283 stop:1653 length:1371 start_codon:yes stop_codon:yes gene_type:complete